MIARTPEARREAAANELKDRMSAISQRGCADGWVEGLEFALWTLVRRGGGTFGRTAVTVTEVGTLRALSQRCGGWIGFDREAGGEILIPRAEWERRFEHCAPAFAGD